MTRYIDFDAARAERKAEPVILKAYGREFRLPPALPASVFLDTMRMQEEAGEEHAVTHQEAVAMMEGIVPADVLDSLLAEPDFSLDDLLELTRRIMTTYAGQGSGEAPAPNRATRRAGSASAVRPRGNPAASKTPTP